MYPDRGMSLVFEWDRHKARSNLERHRVSFTEAASVFVDPLAKIFADVGHSTEEQREIIVGHSTSQRLLVAIFTETDEPDSHYQRPMRYKKERGTIMKRTAGGTVKSGSSSDMLREYRFDYTKAKPNRFAKGGASVTIALDPDVARVFNSAETVNAALRSLLPAKSSRRRSSNSGSR
jgi:uncharacterized DUF497 family protein